MNLLPAFEFIKFQVLNPSWFALRMAVSNFFHGTDAENIERDIRGLEGILKEMERIKVLLLPLEDSGVRVRRWLDEVYPPPCLNQDVGISAPSREGVYGNFGLVTKSSSVATYYGFDVDMEDVEDV